MADKPLIEKLTPEQEILHDQYLEMGLNDGWCSKPADRPAAEAAMLELYKLAGKPAPKFVWFASPQAVARTIVESGQEYSGLSGVDGAMDAHWTTFYNFCAQIGVVYDKADADQLAVWTTLVKSTGPVWPFAHYCLMSERPTIAKRDAQNRLHCDDGPALQYAEDEEHHETFTIYAVHGVVVPEKVVMAPKTLTIDEIQNESNAEVRRVMIDRFGVGEYLYKTKAELVHADMEQGNDIDPETGKPVAIPRGLVRTTDGSQWLVGTDTSTGRVYHMPVPSDVRTCREAHEAISGIAEDTLRHQS
jgi:hypothetical protein